MEAAAKAGLVEGCKTGEYYPNDDIARQEVAAILVRTLGMESAAVASADVSTTFSDDPDSSWCSLSL